MLSKKQKNFTKTEVIEKLAELEHEQWGHWIKYQDKLFDDKEKGYDIWSNFKGLAKTPYYQLTEKQKESDREWARKAYKILVDSLVTKLQKLDYKFKKIPRLVIPDYHADCRQWFNQIERTLRDFEKDWKEVLVILKEKRES